MVGDFYVDLKIFNQETGYTIEQLGHNISSATLEKAY